MNKGMSCNEGVFKLLECGVGFSGLGDVIIEWPLDWANDDGWRENGFRRCGNGFRMAYSNWDRASALPLR